MEVDHSIILKYIETIGFVGTSFFAILWTLIKASNRLLDSHIDFINTVKAQVTKLADTVDKWPKDPKEICNFDVDHVPVKRRS